MQENVVEGASYAQQKEKCNCPLCKYCKRKTHLECFYWWSHDAICENCRQADHFTKVCKLKDNLRGQVVEALIKEKHFFKNCCI